MPADNYDLTGPFPYYIMRPNAQFTGDGLQALSSNNQYYYIVNANNAPVEMVGVRLDGSANPVGFGVHTWAKEVSAGLTALRNNDQVLAGSFEVRLFTTSLDQTMVIWLKSDTANGDLFYAVAGAPPKSSGITLNTLYTYDQFQALLLARGKAVSAQHTPVTTP